MFKFFQYSCGRSKENKIICLSLLVSRRHCIFIRNNADLYITDLGVCIKYDHFDSVNFLIS